MVDTSVQHEFEGTIQLTERTKLLPPVHWQKQVTFDNVPFRLCQYGTVTFRPPDSADVELTWRIVNWLFESPVWKPFLELLLQPKKLDPEKIKFLYPTLVRIPSEFLTSAEIIFLPGVGPVLQIEYEYPEERKGTVRYAIAHSSTYDVQMIGYEGSEPAYGLYLPYAIRSMDSLAVSRDADDN